MGIFNTYAVHFQIYNSVYGMAISFVEIYTTNVCRPGKNARLDALIVRKRTYI